MTIERWENKWRIRKPEQSEGWFLEVIASECGYRVGEICRWLECSERYFRRVFSRDIGLSPKQWLREERMVEARRRIQEGAALEDIALALGFSSSATFRREFFDAHGVRPREWIEPRAHALHKPMTRSCDPNRPASQLPPHP